MNSLSPTPYPVQQTRIIQASEGAEIGAKDSHNQLSKGCLHTPQI